MAGSAGRCRGGYLYRREGKHLRKPKGGEILIVPLPRPRSKLGTLNSRTPSPLTPASAPARPTAASTSASRPRPGSHRSWPGGRARTPDPATDPNFVEASTGPPTSRDSRTTGTPASPHSSPSWPLSRSGPGRRRGRGQKGQRGWRRKPGRRRGETKTATRSSDSYCSDAKFLFFP